MLTVIIILWILWRLCRPWGWHRYHHAPMWHRHHHAPIGGFGGGFHGGHQMGGFGGAFGGGGHTMGGGAGRGRR